MITKIERYVYDGKEFKDLDDIKQSIGDHLGAIVDSFDITLTPKQKIKIFDGLLKERAKIVRLFSVEYDVSEDPLYEDIRNILD